MVETSPDDISAIVRAGARAPSGDNCQPWHFRWNGRRLEVLFDSERAASFYDVCETASWISLGAVLANMAIEAQARGLALSTCVFPPGSAPGVVAWCRLSAGSADASLASAIDARCVNRHPYRSDRIPLRVRDELFGVTTGDARLLWVDEDRPKAELARLAAENDRLLFEHRQLHQGLFRWLRWSRAEADRTRDGLPIDTLGLALWERPGFRLLRSWRVARVLATAGMTRMLAQRARRVYERSGAIALLSVRGRAPEDFVRGGEVLERLWLTATHRGLACQPITGITFLLLRLMFTGGEGLSVAHRRRLEGVAAALAQILPDAADRTPIMLFRLGFAPPPSGRALRRPLEQILQADGEPSHEARPP